MICECWSFELLPERKEALKDTNGLKKTVLKIKSLQLKIWTKGQKYDFLWGDHSSCLDGGW